MNAFSDAKKIYNTTEIPDELEKVVREAIEAGTEETRKKKKSGRFSVIGKISVAACAVFALLGVLNTFNPLYNLSDNNNTDVKYGRSMPDAVMPKTMRSAHTNAVVNVRINEALSEQVANARQGYDEADELNSENISVIADYCICYESDDIVSFIVSIDKSWDSSGRDMFYYNIRTSDASDITLEDFLGKDYAEKVDRSMNKKGANASARNVPVAETDVSFAEKMSFYINASGNAVVVFSESGTEYEITE